MIPKVGQFVTRIGNTARVIKSLPNNQIELLTPDCRHIVMRLDNEWLNVEVTENEKKAFSDSERTMKKVERMAKRMKDA